VAKFPHFHPNITHQAGSTRKRCWSPARAGLLAALIGVPHGLETHVLDRVTDGLKPDR
jgi:hypothetical protein